MEQFHFIVLTIATIFLILIFVFVGFLISQKNTKAEFPPIGMEDNKCPNYWIVKEDGNKCINTAQDGVFKNIGDLSKNYFDVQKNHPVFGVNAASNGLISYTAENEWILDKTKLGIIDKGKSDECNAKKWSTFNDIVWDGVSSKTNC